MKKLILKHTGTPSEVLMLTSAVRDLHLSHPNKFVTDVRTYYPELWANSPYLRQLSQSEEDVEIVECINTLWANRSELSFHAIHSFTHFLNEYLDQTTQTIWFKPELNLTSQEKKWISQVHEKTGEDTRFWIIAIGDEKDNPLNLWPRDRYQQVVDHFRDRIFFVQTGLMSHEPSLEGVLDMRGKTDMRQLVRLVHHSWGVITPPSLLMHLAAGVEGKASMPANRPCIVIAGGSDPPQWNAYTNHQYLHPVGALRCCDSGGCGKTTLRAGDETDESACVNMAEHGPRCLEVIRTEEVINAIEMYGYHKHGM